MKALSGANFKKNYQLHLQHLKLKGLQPKTIEAYSRAIRRIGDRFDHRIDNLCEQQLTDYFTELVTSGFRRAPLTARRPASRCSVARALEPHCIQC